jgi:uncharacterized Zn finger protein
MDFTEQQDLACEVCHVGMPSKNNLKKHMRQVHNENKVPCDTCGKVVKNKYTLMGHIK